MANKTIRLTYLWADEFVMRNDFSGKISVTMTDWMYEFFQRYDFSLDIDPPFDIRRLGLAKLAAKYALQKNNGVRPDRDLVERLIQERRKREDSLNRQREELRVRIEALDRDLTVKKAQHHAKKAQVTARRSAFQANPSAQRLDELNQAEAELQLLETQRDELTASINTAKQQSEDMFQQLLGLRDEFDRKEMEGDWDRLLRIQMSLQHKKHRVGSDRRLSIVFCEFEPPLKGPDDLTSGLATLPIRPVVRLPGLGLNVPTSIFLWPDSFVIVNLKGQRRTIAHEAIHATDPRRNHPRSHEIADKMAKWMQSLPQPLRSTGSVFGSHRRDNPTYLDYLAHFQELNMGDFDGAANDIMNSRIKDGEPAEYILNDEDKALLEKAFFVVP
jgi:hypothetical protein